VRPNLRIPSECFPSRQVVNVHWCILVHVTLVVWSNHPTPKCQEKQTPEPCPFRGPGQSIVIRKIWALCSFCSVPPYSITLFYTKWSCWVSWPSWWSDPLIHLYAPFLWAGRAWNAGYAYWCGYLRFLAILIASIPKSIYVIPSMIGYPITKQSLTVLKILLFRHTFWLKS
jgi:hypothetical protein